MNTYSTLVFLHVITAILGLGPLTVLAIVSRPAAAGTLSLERFAQLLRLVGLSLLAMFLTGAGLIALTRGALGQTGWVRASFGLFLVLGALHGITRRRLHQVLGATPPQSLPPSTSPLLWTMCGVIAVITYLMEAKPF